MKSHCTPSMLKSKLIKLIFFFEKKELRLLYIGATGFRTHTSPAIFIPVIRLLCLDYAHYAYYVSTTPVQCLLCLYYAYYACTIPTMPVLSLLCLYYACTMPMMPVLCLLCLYYAYYSCTMPTMPVLCLLCLFITILGV